MIEPSTSHWLQIYQPVIVGLGAVVLGLLANGALEWWRAYLREKKDLKSLRHSILFECKELATMTEGNSVLPSVVNPEGSLIRYPISNWLLSLDSREIGNLTRQEVEKVGRVLGFMRRINSTKGVVDKNIALDGAIWLFSDNEEVERYKGSLVLFKTHLDDAVQQIEANL